MRDSVVLRWHLQHNTLFLPVTQWFYGSVTLFWTEAQAISICVSFASGNSQHAVGVGIWHMSF